MDGIHVRGATKHYGPVRALDGVDLCVEPGQVVALLGPNGAGKTTLIRILGTNVIPDSGTVEVQGVDAQADPRRVRSLIGLVLPEERSFFWRLSGARNLEFFAALHGIRRREARDRATEALRAVGLGDVSDRRVDRYSTGMRARLSIARALISRPSVLLLDEPTRSLDPVAAISIRNVVTELSSSGRVAVLFATHDLHEAASIASLVVILVGGKVANMVPRGADAAALESALVEAIA